MKKIWCLNIIIFLAAFLSFQLELIISKTLLLKFGGGYTVWGAAIVFFQGILLLGYLYSHYVIQRLGIGRYRYFHLALLLLTLFFFPGRPLPAVNSHLGIPIVIDIFGQLLGSIGIVFFVLSTTSIIFQVWLAESELTERNNPYVLYAVSNLGSFAGLLSYPLLFELMLTLNTQLKIWRIIYLVLFCFHLIAFKMIALKEGARQKPRASDNVGFKDKLVWFLLSVAAAAVFLSVTNIITYEITPMPLLWVIPLCIYLLSFVLNFKKSPWCPSWIRDKFHITTAYAIFLFFLTQKRILPLLIEIACHLFMLFIFCMFCQNELNRRKPGLSHNLTIFYLMIACGGFVGGLLVSWVFPLISTSMVEYLFGLFIIFLALIIDTKTKKLIPIDSAWLFMLPSFCSYGLRYLRDTIYLA